MATRVAVPKATMYKYTGHQFGQYNIGISREVLPMKAEPVAMSMQKTSNPEFRLSIFPANTGHHPRSCRLIYNIHPDHSIAESSYEY